MKKVTDFQKLYDGAYYTIIGCGGNLNEWVQGYEKMMEETGIGKPAEWYNFTGRDMNMAYNLSGINQFKGNLQFLAFPLDGLSVGKLAAFRLAMEDKWFNDLVDNSRDKFAA